MNTIHQRVNVLTGAMNEEQKAMVTAVIETGTNRDYEGFCTVQKVAFELYDQGYGDAHHLAGYVRDFPSAVRDAMEANA